MESIVITLMCMPCCGTRVHLSIYQAMQIYPADGVMKHSSVKQD